MSIFFAFPREILSEKEQKTNATCVYMILVKRKGNLCGVKKMELSMELLLKYALHAITILCTISIIACCR